MPVNNIDNLYNLYYNELSDRYFDLHLREVGGKRRKTITLAFRDFNADHLIGEDSDWHEDKVEAFQRLCTAGKIWSTVGDYRPSMGVRLDADILVGNPWQAFAFREDDDGTYYPVSCLLLDVRDYIYRPWWKVESIDCEDMY